MKGGEMNPYVLFLTIFYLFQLSIAISRHPLLLVISLDGFWPGYLEQYKAETKNLREIAKSGVSSKWMENVFLTKTLPNHQTIATGLYEESHGIIANSFYDPVLNETFTSNLTDAKWWDTGPTPIWILNQQAGDDRKSGGMMWPGTLASIKNDSAFYAVPYYEKLNVTKLVTEIMDITDEVISWMIDVNNPANFVLLYIPEPDLTGHKYGPNSKEMRHVIAKIDASIGKLKEKFIKADLYSKLNIIILSDHGMAEVTPERIIVLDQILNHSYSAYGDSPVLAIHPDPGQEEFVYKTFKNASIRHNFTFKIYKKEKIPISYHYKNNPRVPPYLLMAEEGYDILLSKDVKNVTGPYGNHGYNNSVKSMHALFIARGPAFRSGGVVPPIRNIDLYPLMCHILQLVPEKSNGTLLRCLNLLKNPFGMHVTDKWLIVVCSILGLCILIAAVSSFFVNKNGEYDDANKGAKRMRQNRSGEENTYLLLTSADEV